MKKTKLIFLGICISLLIIFSSFYLLHTINGINLKIEHRKNSILYQVNQTFGGSEDDYGRDILETSDGGFVIAGGTRSFGVGLDDLLLVKTNSNGKQLWNRTYGGLRKDSATAIIETNDGDLAIVGLTSSYGVVSNDFWFIKTDYNGKQLWNRTYGGIETDQAYALIQTLDGGFAIAGRTGSIGSGFDDMWLVKIDNNGLHRWNKTYGGLKNEWALGIIQTNDGGFALIGSTKSYGKGGQDMWLVKTDAQGEHQWNQTYGGLDDDGARAIVQTIDGGFALVGETGSLGAGGLDMWLVKTNSVGEAQWNQTYGGPKSDHANDLVQTTDGGFVLVGKTFSFGNEHVWLVKTDKNGNSQWNQTYGQTAGDAARAVVQTTDGDFVIAGQIGKFFEGDLDMWLLKTNQFFNLTSLEIVYQFIKDNPESLFALTPAIIVIFLLYYIKRKNPIGEKKSELYPTQK